MFIGLAYALLWVATLVYVVRVWSARRLPGWAATGITWIAWGLLVAGLVERALRAGHWPLTNRYEFALCWAWMVITLYLLSEASWHERRAGVFVLAIALLAMTYAVTRPAAEQAITPLLPALRSVWLQVHVLTALVGYGAFSVAAGWGLAQLLPTSSPVTTGESQGGDESERVMMRVLALGFPWLTLSILTGAIWAQNAWGRYWGWDPKETWALVTWLWYLLIMHVRSLRGWRGRRLAGLVVAGLGVVIFSFIGVPWLVRTARLESLHGF